MGHFFLCPGEVNHTASIAAALDSSDCYSHGQAGSHAPYDEANHCNYETHDKNGFSAITVSCSSPRHGGKALEDGKG